MSNKTNNAGNFDTGGKYGNAMQLADKLSVSSVENAHDKGNRDQYKAPLRNNASR